jgi:hypothetical protein
MDLGTQGTSVSKAGPQTESKWGLSDYEAG